MSKYHDTFKYTELFQENVALEVLLYCSLKKRNGGRKKKSFGKKKRKNGRSGKSVLR